MGYVAVPAASASTMPGQLLGFGGNDYGQLARTPDHYNINLPAVAGLPAAAGRVVDAAVGEDFSLALTSSGRLYAFGDNYNGALGTTTNAGTTMPVATPTQVILPGLKGHIVQVAAGWEQSLVLTSTGQVYAFGINWEGELGNSTNIGTPAANPTPTRVTLPGATGSPVRIAAGYETSYALTSTGELFAWGEGDSGQLGTGSTSYENPTPAPVLINGSSTRVASFSVGGAHVLVLTKAGALYAFGSNQQGQLGRAQYSGTTHPFPKPIPVQLPGGSGRVVLTAAGDESSYVATSTGRLYAFGGNVNGQLCSTLNYATYKPNPIFQVVPLGQIKGRIVQLQAGYYDLLILSSSGRLYACGSDGFGQLGVPINKKGNFDQLTAASLIGPGTTLDTLAPGPVAEHTLAIVADLRVTTSSLARGTAGKTYRVTIRASGGTPAFRWSAVGLPRGLTIGSLTGKLHGTPTTAGRHTVTLTVSDAQGITTTRQLPLVIATP
jgi:alpha-tubulin suppressor-like RCC1 family protein